MRGHSPDFQSTPPRFGLHGVGLVCMPPAIVERLNEMRMTLTHPSPSFIP
jgi:hypothetical protein